MSYTRTIAVDQRLRSSLNGVGYLYGPIRSQTRTGSRVDQHRFKIKNQLQASSAFSATYWNYKNRSQASVSMTYNPSYALGTSITKSYTGFPGVNQVFVDYAPSVENAALSALYTKLRLTRSQMNGLTVLGELRDTVKLLRNPASALIKGFFDWSDNIRVISKQSSFQGVKGRRRFQRVASDSFLEAQFGWRPLISDVQGIAQTVARLVVNSQNRIDSVVVTRSSSGGRANEVWSVLDPAVPDSVPYVAAARWDRRYKSFKSCRYQAFISSSVTGDSTMFSRVAQVSGFTLENIVPTLYELTPYSFLLDYASNLGECINARFTDVSNFRHGIKTTVSKDEVDIISDVDLSSIRAETIANGHRVVSLTGMGGRLTEIRTSLNRTVLNTLPMPNLQFTLTSSGLKVGNVLALIGSNLSKAGLLR